ncbi:salivary peroxidase/catechol oxidase-like [Epargyreus clarus]|uniref:salivary peroxidase/catechol oxidase-like n=1 Tax=Epargyreus clarus TaxID=520877 RepID=UPI003C2D95B2
MLLPLLISVVAITGTRGSDGIVYDAFTGNPISPEEVKRHEKLNTTFWCTNKIQPCDPHEWRRVDGSCNNLKNPTKGAPHTPVYRLLPAMFGKDFGPRKAEDGGPLPLCRPLRTHFYPEGYLPDQKFTHLLTYALVFLTSDVLSVHDTVNYVLWTPYCCEPKGKTDPNCIPNKVPNDDPVHRFSDIRCLNMTVPVSFQSMGCIRKDTIPERIISNLPLFDLSQVYGNTLKALNEKGRLFYRGLLKYEIENGNIWPPSTKKPGSVCILNQRPYETRCHDTPDSATNSILGINLFSIWTWRLHNKIATELSEMNPCWKDETIFYVTRDIIIAVINQIYYFEMWPALMGRENLIRDSVISSSPGFRDIYNEDRNPRLSSEFSLALRWAHTFQESNIRLLDADGYHMKNIKMTNLTLRTAFLLDHMEYITQSAFRQACGKIDYAVDWDMAEVALGPQQRASDVFTNDICKNRYLGSQPYVAYKEFCFGKSYETFDDLLDSIAPERLELLKHKYRHVRDIDLSVGMSFETFVEGGHVPPTFYCIVVEQLIQNIVSDRHWYERQNRPHAFTYDQLQSIRKMTVARLLCDVGDSVTQIQPKAFYRIRPGNELCNCDEIEKLDLTPWKDQSCYYNKPYGKYY